MKITDYVDKCYSDLESYIKGVQDGSIVTSIYIKQAVQRYLDDLERDDLVFRKDKLDRVLKFFACVNIRVGTKRLQFPLIPYQVFILFSLFGFYYKSEPWRRKYNYAFLFISRKNGKSSFATCILLYLMVADGMQSTENILIANSQSQSTINLNMAKDMIRNSPLLKKEIQLLQYSLKKETNTDMSFMRSFPYNSVTLDGYNPSGVILDETHEYPDDKIFSGVKTGIGNRMMSENPMIFQCSSAGYSTNSFCYSMFNYGKEVLRGDLIDDHFFFALYSLDDMDDPNDSKNWIKSNPSINQTIPLSYLESEYNQSKRFPSIFVNFVTKNLNIFSSETKEWISESVVRSSERPFNLDDHKGKTVFIGLDLSATRDLSALSVCIPDGDTGNIWLHTEFWIPDSPDAMNRKTNFNIINAIREGYITKSESKTIDYNQIINRIVELSQVFEIQSIAFDSYQSPLIQQRLEDYGFYCGRVPMSAKFQSYPVKYIEKGLYDGTIFLSPSPVMRWCFSNVVLYSDCNNNQKILKNKSLDPVDGCISACMSVFEYIRHYSMPEINQLLNMVNELKK